MRKKNKSRSKVLGMVGLAAMVWVATGADAALPPPPGAPPAPIQTGISVSGPVAVDEGMVAQFACVANYSDGSTQPIFPIWSVDSASASINASGLLSAGDVAADQIVAVTATSGGFATSQNITIQYVAPVLTGLSISGASIVDEETSAQYSCTASYSDGATKTVTAAWSEDSTFAFIDSSGLLSLGNVLADQSVMVTASFDGMIVAKTVTIKYVAPVLISLSISGASIVDEETSAQYVCIAHYSDDTSAQVAALWNEYSSFASVSGTGLLAAGNVLSDQSLVLIASYGGLSGSMTVTISYVAPTLTGLVISGATRVDEESSAQYSCTALYSDGTSKVVAPAWSQNSGYASIDASGLLVTGDVTVDQNFTITAFFGGKVDSQVVTLAYVAPPVVITGITIQGLELVGENTNVQFVCTAAYSDGTSKTVIPAWSEDSALAAIDAAGVLSVGNFEADGSLNITATFEGKSDSHQVAVLADKARLTYSLSGFAGKRIKADLWDEAAQELRPLGEMVNPTELVITDLEPAQWYWLVIKEYNADSGEWVKVHANWVCM